MNRPLAEIEFFTPATLNEALALRDAERSRALPIAGGTDLMVLQRSGGLGAPRAFLSLWGVEDLRGITLRENRIEIGATTTFAQIGRSPEIDRHVTALGEAARRVGAVQIQNRATIGGNIVNGSPAGDSLPVLAVVNATLVLASKARGLRKVPFEAFFTGYRQTVLQDDELLVRIEIPLPPADTWTGFEKVGSRRAQTISKVMAALRVRLEGDKIADVAFACGSVAPTVIRLPRTEARLLGRPLSEHLADEVADTLNREIVPIDDLRSTAAYRRFVSVGLLRRLLRRCAQASG